MPELTDHLWVRLTPAGCAYNALPGNQAATADEAHQQLFPDPRERQGFRVELYSRQQWKQHGAPCFQARCGHQAGEA